MKRREFIRYFSSALTNAAVLWPRFALGDDEPAVAPSVDQPAAAPASSDQPQSDQSAAPQVVDDSVGQVATLTGMVTVKRGDTQAIALKLTDPVFVNDTLRTGVDSSLGVTFDDQTTFSLSANTFIVVDKFLFEPDGKDNAASIFVGKGTAAFVASLVAKTGDMHVTTESAVIGIRGTTGVVDIPEAGAGPDVVPTVKLYPDADGHVGQIEISDFQGARLGTLTQGASAFAIRRAGPDRITVEPYQIQANESVRDRGVLQRLTTSHDLGRQMAIQRQQLRGPNRLQQPNNNQQRPGGNDQRGGQNNDRGRDNNQRGNENRNNENRTNENKVNENKANENKANENKANENKERGEKDRGNGNKDRRGENKERGRDTNERGQNNERGGRDGRGPERAGPGFERGRQNAGPNIRGGGPGGQSGELSGGPHGGFGGLRGPGGLGLGRGPAGGLGGPSRGPVGRNPFERKNH